MSNKPYLRLFALFQAFLFTGYGLILKSLEDVYADQFLIIGIGILVFFAGRALYRQISRNFQKKESL